MGDTINVNASTGDVGCHQDRDVAIFETCKGLCPGALALVSVDGSRRNTALIQLLDQPVCSVFGSCEHDSTLDAFLLDDLHQQSALVCLSEEHDFLLDSVDGNLFRRDVHFNGVVQKRTSKVRNRRWHGCAKKEVLSLLREKF